LATASHCTLAFIFATLNSFQLLSFSLLATLLTFQTLAVFNISAEGDNVFCSCRENSFYGEMIEGIRRDRQQKPPFSRPLSALREIILRQCVIVAVARREVAFTLPGFSRPGCHIAAIVGWLQGWLYAISPAEE